ncbi:hypothetical protein PLANPX_4121 [Lacipirellula parvula]|uniref:Uncharacterized protein n=1 Tax=Lacipirellula parvula TaxID=2650471 RepID=A0A5K7XN36_9BACT|nr:hypothetical protein PLANPX_4121 [Lacipirellula parvula]
MASGMRQKWRRVGRALVGSSACSRLGVESMPPRRVLQMISGGSLWLGARRLRGERRVLPWGGCRQRTRSMCTCDHNSRLGCGILATSFGQGRVAGVWGACSALAVENTPPCGSTVGSQSPTVGLWVHALLDQSRTLIARLLGKECRQRSHILATTVRSNLYYASRRFSGKALVNSGFRRSG